MSTSILLLALSVGAGVGVGAILYRHLAARKRYFDELERFIDYVISDVKYRRTDLLTLRQGFEAQDPNFAKNLDEWVAGLENGKHKLSRGKLKATELSAVEEILFKIGKVGLTSQLFELEASREKVRKIGETSATKLKTYGGLSVKLGLLGGLALGILLL